MERKRSRSEFSTINPPGVIVKVLLNPFLRAIAFLSKAALPVQTQHATAMTGGRPRLFTGIHCMVLILISMTVSLHGQDQPSHYDSLQQKIKSEIKTSDSTKIHNAKQQVKQTFKTESQSIKSSAKNELIQSLPDTTKPDTKKITQTAGDKLTDKATNLQYDSDNPDDAPWKKKQFSEDDLKDFDLQSIPKEPGIPALNGDKVKTYQNKVENINPSSPDGAKLKEEVTKTAKSPKLEKAKNTADSLIALHEQIDGDNLEQEILGAKRVYSEKYIKRVYDSLGLKKADSLFNVASAFIKTETPREELLDRINTPLKEKAGKEGVSFDEENQSLKMDDAEKLNGLPNQFSEMDLSSLQLPQDVLSELAPLTGRLTDSKYVPLIDSLRDVAMKAKGYSLDEEQVTEEIKKTVVKKKPRLIDKSYFEGILGFVNDSTISIVQLSPAWAYNFTNRVSAGLGPNISVQYQKNKLNAVVGYRSFVKSEFWKQRLYAQLEDNFMPAKINREAIGNSTYHSILLGGGGLLPLSKKLAINLSLFYRINQEQVRPGGSPWVFRVGISSIKKVSKD